MPTGCVLAPYQVRGIEGGLVGAGLGPKRGSRVAVLRSAGQEPRGIPCAQEGKEGNLF